MKRIAITALVVLAAAMSIALIAAIYGKSLTGLAAKYEPAANPGQLENVTLKLKWYHQAQFSGFYVAAEKGFYRQEGIDINIEPLSMQSGPIDSVASGKAEFGITGADELLIARENGSPIKAISVIYQTSPIAAYSLKSSGIETPFQFAGKKVGLEEGGGNVLICYKAMMSRLNIDQSGIKEVPIGYTGEELLNKTVDVATGYLINEPYRVEEAGNPVNIIRMADYGADIYADTIFASEKTIQDRPGLVERFLRASLKGWTYAIENEPEAAKITMQYSTSSTLGHEDYMLRKSIPLIFLGNAPIGAMDGKRWQYTRDFLIEQGMLSSKENVSDAFAPEFIDRLSAQR